MKENLKNRNRNRKGFTLIELSIVIVIAGSIAAGILALLSIDSATKSSEITINRLDVIEEALAAFMNTNGYLPCPADRNGALGTADYAVSTNCTVSTSYTSDIDSGAEQIRIGALPTRDLNLPDSYAADGWDNKFTYAVVSDLAQSEVLFNAHETTASNGVIQVVDGTPQQILDNTSEFPVVAYIIISHGKNGKGSYTINGSPNGNPCGSVTKDSENCDIDIVFMDTQIDNFTSTEADVYDDIVRWETKGGIVRKANIYDK